MLLSGCQQKMADQPSLKPLLACDFDPDGSSLRLPVEGTVARGHLRVDSALFRGRPAGGATKRAAGAPVEAAEPSAQATVTAEALANADVVSEFPLTITRDLLEHGHDRYMIYCVVCHDPLGTGHGKIVERGYVHPPSYHIPRLRQAPVGHLFVVASEGYGAMPSYREQISARDRWAIVAYVRALQLSQHYPEEDLSLDLLRQRDKTQRSASTREVPR
jgi:mono/diheme cytochrome c family protein